MAYTYAVSFRIANRTVNGRTYDQRRSDLIDFLRDPPMGFWDETTSFMLVESDASTERLTKKGAAALSSTYDMLFIFDPGDQSACYFGAVEGVEVLRSFFPKLKKIE